MNKHYTIYTLLFIILLGVTAQAQTVFRGTVIDAATKQPIANARVGINNQGVGEITSDKGFFNYKKYHEVLNAESQLVVGASGYESLQLDAEKVRLLFNRSSKIELQPTSKEKERKEVTNLTVFWDVSEDMKGRDVAAEVAYVQEYVSMHKDLTLRFVAFDYKVRTDERIVIRGGDISRFRESVKALVYNGPSNYDVLDSAGADAVILSSNGNPNYGTLNVSQDIPVYAIASEDIEVNKDYMQLLGQYTQGVYRPIQSDEGNITRNTSTTRVFEGATIKGTVTSLGKSLQEVSIIKKGDLTEYLTKADGTFELPAKEGDILQLQYLGMFPKDILIENQDDLTIELLPKNDMLEEVVIESRYKQIIVGDKYVRGEKDPYNPMGMTSRGDFFITSEDIDPKGHTLDELIRIKFPNIQMRYGAEGRYFLVAGAGPQWVLDGAPLTLNREPPPFYLQDFEIESIIVKESKYATFRFGPEVKGVAIIVTTKKVPLAREKYVDSGLVKNNEYTEEVSSISDGVIAAKMQVTGKVTSLGKPIQGATISVKGSFKEFTSQRDGSFTANLSVGDMIKVNYLGMYPKLIVIDDETKEIEVDLLPKSDMLDEVEITGKAKESTNKRVDIENGRYSDPFLGSFNVQTLTREDTNIESWASVALGISGKFSNVQVSSRPGFEEIEIRDTPAQYYINGTPVDKVQFFTVNPQNIATISVKKDIGGLIGRAILIDTVDFVASNTPVPSALVEGNEYEEEIKSLETNSLNVSSGLAITGVVKDLKGVLADATITRKGSFDEVFTDAQGRFEIKVSLGAVLMVSKVGMFTKEVLVESQDMGIITLTAKNDNLDEIVVSGDKRVDNTIERSDGRRVNKDKLGYAAQELTENDFAGGATNLQQLITGKVSGVSVAGGLYSGSQVVYKIRGGNQSIENEIPPIWIVNGIPYPDPPEFLDVQQIASITVLKSASATSRYGTLAAGGAFLIKTKEVSFQDKAKKAQKSALVSGNEYTEASTQNIDTSTLPSYILRLREIPNLQEQFELYQRISRTQESPLEFYVDVAQYFDGINTEMADQVRADLAYISRNNTKALRTLCYIYEAAGDYEKAALIYERILKLAPSEAQSYRDLALIYQEIGKYNEALELYYNMLGEQIKGVNFQGLEKSIKNELSHLLSLHKDQIDYERFPNEWLRTDFDIDIRMVIDWSDRSVPFEFQFVNPDKKFFKWTHTLEETRDRLEEEQTQGYQSEEFIIDDAPPGEWLINIQYLGDEGDYVLPPFMKYTVYKNYGTPEQTKEIKVVKLFKQSDKVTLGKVVL